ncbi:MAG: 50S ribosomal protein L19 [Candidatus Omnitrophica bacterium]|nr:50S ribosomal protein L19 [Candidatus Omnitrophota bacterium]
MDKVQKVREKYARKEMTKFDIGDTIDVHFKIKEENKMRIQVFTGIVISIKGAGMGKTFTVRRISYGEGVERIFPFHSPLIDKVEVKKKGKVRRAKLYYLRGVKGKKATKVREKVVQSKEK